MPDYKLPIPRVSPSTGSWEFGQMENISFPATNVQEATPIAQKIYAEKREENLGKVNTSTHLTAGKRQELVDTYPTKFKLLEIHSHTIAASAGEVSQ